MKLVRTAAVPTGKPPTTKGVPAPLFHGDDWAMLQRLREELMGRRVFLHRFYGESGESLAAKQGRGSSFISDLEGGDMRIVLSHLQLWCRMFDFELGFELWQDDPDPEGKGPFLYLEDLDDPDVKMMTAMSQISDRGMRLLLLTRLATIRRLKKITSAEMGKQLGVSAESVRRWEDGAKDPMLPPLLQRARALGMILKFRVIRPDEL